MSGRRRAESLKGLTLPKYSRPQTEEEMASMHNYRDSGILLLSLTQSRQAWTSSILKKFSSKQEVIYQPKLPEYTNPNAIVSLLGKCHITIGPHTFYDTKIYEAVYEKEMPNPDIQVGNFQIQQPTQLGSLQSPAQQQTQSSAQSLTQTPPSVIQLPLQQPLPATHTQQSSQAKTPTSGTSSTSSPTNLNTSTPKVPPQATPQLTAFMQTVLQSVNPTQILAIQEHLRHPQVAAHMSIEQKNALISQLTIIHQLLTSTQIAQQKTQQQTVHSRTQSPAMRVRQVVRHEVLLEFKETKNDKWLFPKDAILEALSMSEPYDVLASFYLPQNEDTSGSKQQHQPVTMHMTNITQPMLDALKKATNDVTTVFKSMAAKVNKQPNRVYLQYCLPCDYPEDLLEAIGQKVAKLDGTTIVDNITPPKEKKQPATKKQKPRNGEGSKAASRTSNSAPKKAKTVHDVASVTPVPTSGSSGGNKRCAYCFCKSTPMWRRGPDGAGTLCNACGVKWKQGKILQGTNTNRATESNGDSMTVAPSPKSRKYSLSAACTPATATTTAKTKKKPGRSLSMSEGALSLTDDDENRDKNLGNTGENLNTEAQKSGSGRRASTSSKKNSFKDPESPDIVSSPSRSPQYPSVSNAIPTSRTSTTASTSTTNSPTIVGGGGGFPINLKLNSISFGSSGNNLIGGNNNSNNQQGGNYYFSQPNCNAQVFEDCLKIGLEKDGYEKTAIDIWKENIEFLNFENERDLATGIPLLSVQAYVSQHVNRFDQELLNPDHNNTLVTFNFINLNVNFRPTTTMIENNGYSNDIFRSGESRDLKTFLEKWVASGINITK
ncbi:9416_t:CDS:10 [Dentiscutata erythropus]|uniref:9416_t:CDS:1 n=1 Tax=Dentiscutata erythropus TaxID=1348616 RepID=A0A9N9AGC7_9GLOM|nr:9416_t:CDS:10 [Dentiscutata erythropus]